MDISLYITTFLSRLFNNDKIITDKYKSVFEINYKKLKEQKIKLIIFDIDDTICPDKAPMTESMKKFLKIISKDFKIALISNSASKSKIKIGEFATENNMYFFYPGKKPNPKAFLNALNYYKINPENTASVGDRGIDIWTANYANVKEKILIKPYSQIFGGRKARFYIRILRFFENKLI